MYRWGALITAAVLLSRRSYFPFGNAKIFPNMYVVFMGESASRKSTAINLVKKTLIMAGYDRFAPSETSKGKFGMHLAGVTDIKVSKSKAEENLMKELEALERKRLGGEEPTSESFICAGELANFLGFSNFDFASFLGDIWDKDEFHEVSYKNAGEFKIVNPVVNLLGGNTFEGMMKCLPPEMLGQGFLSRCIFVYAPEVKDANKIAFPTASSVETDADFLSILNHLKNVSGPVTMDPLAKQTLEYIYRNWIGMKDHRFKSYAGRRFTQLLKLCMLEAICDRRMEISMRDAIRAHTWLTYTEAFMPKALGEYGAGKSSMGANALMNVMQSAPDIVWQPNQLWERTYSSFDSVQSMNTALGSLLTAGKIKVGNGGFRAATLELPRGQYINYDLFKEYLRL